MLQAEFVIHFPLLFTSGLGKVKATLFFGIEQD